MADSGLPHPPPAQVDLTDLSANDAPPASTLVNQRHHHPTDAASAAANDLAILCAQMDRIARNCSGGAPHAAAAAVVGDGSAGAAFPSPKALARRSAIAPVDPPPQFDQKTPPPACHCTPGTTCRCSARNSLTKSGARNSLTRDSVIPTSERAAEVPPVVEVPHKRAPSREARDFKIQLNVLVDHAQDRQRDLQTLASKFQLPPSAAKPLESPGGLASPGLIFQMDMRSPSPRPLDGAATDTSDDGSNRSSLSVGSNRLASWSESGSQGLGLMTSHSQLGFTPAQSPLNSEPAASPYSPYGGASLLSNNSDPLSIPLQARTMSCQLPVAQKTSLHERESSVGVCPASGSASYTQTNSESTVYRSLRNSLGATGRSGGARSNSVISLMCSHGASTYGCQLCQMSSMSSQSVGPSSSLAQISPLNSRRLIGSISEPTSASPYISLKDMQGNLPSSAASSIFLPSNSTSAGGSNSTTDGSFHPSEDRSPEDEKEHCVWEKVTQMNFPKPPPLTSMQPLPLLSAPGSRTQSPAASPPQGSLQARKYSQTAKLSSRSLTVGAATLAQQIQQQQQQQLYPHHTSNSSMYTPTGQSRRVGDLPPTHAAAQASSRALLSFDPYIPSYAPQASTDSPSRGSKTWNQPWMNDVTHAPGLVEKELLPARVEPTVTKPRHRLVDVGAVFEMDL